MSRAFRAPALALASLVARLLGALFVSRLQLSRSSIKRAVRFGAAAFSVQAVPLLSRAPETRVPEWFHGCRRNSLLGGPFQFLGDRRKLLKRWVRGP